MISVAAFVLVFGYRPFNGTDADVAEKGEIELEIGPLGLQREGARRLLVAPALIANYGFHENWELVVEGRHEVLLSKRGPTDPSSELTDTAASFKGILRRGSMQEESGLSIATEVSAILPTTTDRHFGAQLAMIFSQRWKVLTVHLNFASELTRTQQYNQFIGAIFEGPFAWHVRPVAEIFVEHELGRGRLPEHTSLSALVGAIWRAREGLAFDAGFRAATVDGTRVGELRAGFTWGFDTE